jgi:hypothetical protein
MVILGDLGDLVILGNLDQLAYQVLQLLQQQS